MTESYVSTHVLDTTIGAPAVGVAVVLEERDGDSWSAIASCVTDTDGRARALGPSSLPSGVYRVRFDTGAYFAGTFESVLFPEVSLTFAIDSGQAHYHVPLLLSPFAYSTYRGS